MIIKLGFLIAFSISASNVLAQAEIKVTSYGVLFDNTGSLRFRLTNEREIATEIVRSLGADSSISIFRFKSSETNRNAELELGMQSKGATDVLLSYINKITTVPGQTTLLDAIRQAAEHLADKSDVDKVLIVLSDGEERTSKTKVKDLVSFLQAKGVKIFAVGFIDELDSTNDGFIGASPKKKAKNLLKKITEGTGGRVLFPNEKDTVSEIVKHLFELAVSKSK